MRAPLGRRKSESPRRHLLVWPGSARVKDPRVVPSVSRVETQQGPPPGERATRAAAASVPSRSVSSVQGERRPRRDTVVRAASSPALDTRIGLYLAKRAVEQPSRRARDPRLAERLWDVRRLLAPAEPAPRPS